MTIRNLLNVTITFLLLLSTIQLKAQLTVNASSTDICLGTFTTLYAADTNATSFIWSPSNTLSNDTADTVVAFPTTTTTYTVISFNDTLGYLDTASITITVNTYPVLSTSSTNRHVCEEDTIHLSVTGATNYSWAGATSHLNNTTGSDVVFSADTLTQPVTIIVTGSNSSCSSSLNITVTVDTIQPELIVLESVPHVCVGSTGLLFVSGASNYTWSSNDVFDSILNGRAYISPVNTNQPTSYTVTGNIGACTDSHTFSVIAAEPAQFNISQTSLGLPLCMFSHDTISFSGNTTHYRLYTEDGTLYTVNDEVEFSVVKSQTVVTRGYTDYECMTVDSFNLIVDTTCVDSTYYVDGIESLSDLSNNVKMYNNNGDLIIESDNSLTNSECFIFDINGRLIHNFTHTSSISRNTLPNNIQLGTYIVYLKKENAFARKKIILH